MRQKETLSIVEARRLRLIAMSSRSVIVFLHNARRDREPSFSHCGILYVIFAEWPDYNAKE
jgi:hypothetical protein